MESIFLLIPALLSQAKVEFISVIQAKAAIGVATIWDDRPPEDYLAGHIPGAVNAGDAFEFLSDPKTEDYLPPNELAAKLGQLGVDLSKSIVIYGNNVSSRSFYAARALRFLGAKRVAILIEGYPAWVAAKGKIERTASRLAPAHNAAQWSGADESVDLNQFLSIQKQAHAQILDVRSDDEFAGKDPETLRGGHVPGALHIVARDNFTTANSDGGMPQIRHLKSKAELLAMYASKGLKVNSNLVVYCHGGGRSAATAEILRWLGFTGVKTYEGGWFEYGQRLEVPIEGATVFPVRETLLKMEQLEKRVKLLEAQVPPGAVDAGVKP